MEAIDLAPLSGTRRSARPLVQVWYRASSGVRNATCTPPALCRMPGRPVQKAKFSRGFAEIAVR
jgi:hypothetical protein